jgi:hypothetical protein
MASAQVAKEPTTTKPSRQRPVAVDGSHVRGRLSSFYDFSFHSVSNSSTVNLSDYLVDQRFWERRPSIVVVTPVSPNVLQPDEGHAEALTESLLRQIAADLGVREVQDKVSQTIGLLKKLSKKARSSGDSKGEARQSIEPDAAPPEKAAQPSAAPADQGADRGLRTVQLILLTDARPVWNGMSLFDRSAVVERALSEYLKKVPQKRERLLEFLQPDQFRFGAFPGKEAGNQMMEGLGLRRPELHFLIADRNGAIVAAWTKFTFDAKKISAVYRELLKEGANGD